MKNNNISLTTELLEKEFKKLNHKFFKNEIILLPFFIKPSKKFTAFLSFRGLKTKDHNGIVWQFSNPQSITFSSDHLFTKKDLIETMLHEMIHAIIAQKNEKEYGRSSHGETFASYAYEIEKIKLFNI